MAVNLRSWCREVRIACKHKSACIHSSIQRQSPARAHAFILLCFIGGSACGGIHTAVSSCTLATLTYTCTFIHHHHHNTSLIGFANCIAYSPAHHHLISHSHTRRDTLLAQYLVHVVVVEALADGATDCTRALPISDVATRGGRLQQAGCHPCHASLRRRRRAGQAAACKQSFSSNVL